MCYTILQDLPASGVVAVETHYLEGRERFKT